jgi:formamidopyrimidine-DNA glycosylase
LPELPEAETIARSLRPHLTGRKILDVRFYTQRVSKFPPETILGRTIAGVRRHGKQVLLELDEGLVVFKLGMTGALLVASDPGPYTRALFVLDRGRLCFNDIRQFGSIEILAEGMESTVPDALEMRGEDFVERLRSHDTEVKRLLMDQSILKGLGNIYADEALFRARINPKAKTRRLSKRRGLRLYKAIVELLSLAIEHRGSSISNYVDAAGQRGAFQQLHQVYGKGGRPCPACATPIRRIVLGGRSTHYCPQCQRA